jgi:large subunit ribosomal protein L18
MRTESEKVYKRHRRHLRIRQSVIGTPEKPRLCVFRSARHIYAQIVDDTVGRTLVSASSLKLAPPPVAPPAEAATPKEQTKDTKSKGKEKEKKGKKTWTGGEKTVAAREVGRIIAEAAKEKGISAVCFDRGGYLYHGRIAALADAARKNGLVF